MSAQSTGDHGRLGDRDQGGDHQRVEVVERPKLGAASGAVIGGSLRLYCGDRRLLPRDEAGHVGLGDEPVGDPDALVGRLPHRRLVQVDSGLG